MKCRGGAIRADLVELGSRGGHTRLGSGKERLWSITYYRDLVTPYGLLEYSTHRKAPKIGVVSRIPKDYTPALPAEVPRLYHTGDISPTQTSPTPPPLLFSTREIKGALPYTRSEQMAEQNTRTRRASTIPTSAPEHQHALSSTMHHVRERAAGP